MTGIIFFPLDSHNQEGDHDLTLHLRYKQCERTSMAKVTQNIIQTWENSKTMGNDVYIICLLFQGLLKKYLCQIKLSHTVSICEGGNKGPLWTVSTGQPKAGVVSINKIYIQKQNIMHGVCHHEIQCRIDIVLSI